MDEKERKTFNYTYSAKRQEEIQEIRKKYLPPQEDKMAQLRRLDAGVTQKATAYAVITGIIGTLILGFGMSLLMSELSEQFKFLGDFAMGTGIGIGLVGIAIVCCAYPLYKRTVKKERERIAPEILRLSDELMK